MGITPNARRRCAIDRCRDHGLERSCASAFWQTHHRCPETPQELATLIDHQIILGQRVFDTGRLADALLKKHHLPDDLLPDVQQRFQALISGTPEKYREKLLEIYANPLRQFTLHQQSEL